MSSEEQVIAASYSQHSTEKGEDNTDSSGLPENLLHLFLPGYAPVAVFLNEYFGLDVTYLVSLFLGVVGLRIAIQYGSENLYSIFTNYCMSSITIPEYEDLFDHVTAWVAEHNLTQNCLDLTAHCPDRTVEEAFDLAPNPTEWINYKLYAAKILPQYEPSPGKHWFWHWRRLFMFQRTANVVSEGRFLSSHFEEITLHCFGRSTQPIKDLIEECQAWNVGRQGFSTVVRRPSKSGDNVKWTTVTTRHARLIESISIDHEKVHKLLKDVQEYLHPLTAKWYHSRGIPLRRGYLFGGPPGTGKTSLSFAIAGTFGLDIHSASLVDPNFTEEDLLTLFNRLPRRCIILLEDIDSAGVTLRRAPSISDPSTLSNLSTSDVDSSDQEESTSTQKNKSRSVQKDGKSHGSSRKHKGGVSLSGLLNAIDGVASHEGRVLIMTSNHPEMLDPALIRPGRVDMQVTFTLATKPQIEKIFLWMYKPDAEDGSVSASDRECQARLENEKTTETDDPSMGLSLLARRFAEVVPSDSLSPAEIQGHLLHHKNDPERAVSEATNWLDGLVQKRKRKEENK